MIKKISVFMLVFILLFSFIQITFAVNDPLCEYIYIAADGDDSAAGTADAPLATLNGARDKIREKKADGISPEKGFVVYLRGGEYQVTESVIFDEQDSGTETAPIVYRSYPGEKATIIGGASLPASEFETVKDSEVLARVIDEAAREKLLCVNLKQHGFSDFGNVYLNGGYSYQKPLPTAKPAKSPELFINGQLMEVSKYPNSGYLMVGDVIEQGYQAPGVSTIDAITYGSPEDGFIIKTDEKRISSWKTADQALLYGYWYYDWADSSVPIKSIDSSKGTIESTIPSVYGIKKGQRFNVYNLLEEIDLPGEYFLDRKTGILYLYPPTNFASDSDVKFSILEDNVININGASYIDFKDMKFTSLRKSAVYATSGNNIRVMDCEIEYTAEAAVYFLENTRNCGVMNSYIHDVNGGIVLRGGIYDNLEPGGGYAENNEIARFSRINKTYTGAVTLGGVGNRASYNEIYDGPHLAIQFWGQNNVIEYNEIYNVLQISDDAGAIYGGQTWVGRGLQIRYNYMHDIKSDSEQSVGRAAVYLDGGQCSVDMIGNVVANVQGSAFWVNGGRNNNVINNIAINCEANLYLTDIMATGILPLSDMLNGFKTYPWQDPESEPWKNDIWKEAYPELLPSLEDEPLQPKDNYMLNNVSVNCEPTKFYGAAARFLNMNNNYTTNKDPGFYDMAKSNYLLKEDSVVYKEVPGFIPLPFSRMGRYDTRAIYRVKDAVALSVGSPFAKVYGEDMQIDPENIKVSPKIVDDTTFVPLRFIAEALGAEVSYDEKTKGITISGEGITLNMTVDAIEGTKNGEPITLSHVPFVSEERTLVPLREVSNLFAKEVFWDDRGLIVISSQEDLFNPENDSDIIGYLYNYLTIY